MGRNVCSSPGMCQMCYNKSLVEAWGGQGRGEDSGLADGWPRGVWCSLRVGLVLS